MEDTLVRKKLDKEDVTPAAQGEVCVIDGRTFPVSGYIGTGFGSIPIIDIPVMTDEKWRGLSEKRGKNRLSRTP